MAKIPSDTQWSDLAAKVKAKQDALTAGTGIDATELASDVVEIDGSVVLSSTNTIPSGTILPDVGTDRIVDGAVTSAKLGSEAVQSRNIDYASLPIFAQSSDVQVTIGNNVITLFTFTIPVTGTYFANGVASAYNGADGAYFNAEIYQDSTVIGRTYSSFYSGRAEGCVGAAFSAQAGDVITFKVSSNGGDIVSIQGGRTYSFIVFRVG